MQVQHAVINTHEWLNLSHMWRRSRVLFLSGSFSLFVCLFFYLYRILEPKYFVFIYSKYFRLYSSECDYNKRDGPLGVPPRRLSVPLVLACLLSPPIIALYHLLLLRHVNQSVGVLEGDVFYSMLWGNQ